jgi:hypothetical protein
MSIQKRITMRIAVRALMLTIYLSGITISAFHSHHDCRDTENCAICIFQASSVTLPLDAPPGSDPFDEPVLHSILTATERASEPFHTSVFACHAPPQFC